MHVAGSEDAGDVRHPVLVARHRAAIGQLDAELSDGTLLGADEAHRQQHQLALERELGAGNRLERQAAVLGDGFDRVALEPGEKEKP